VSNLKKLGDFAGKKLADYRNAVVAEILNMRLSLAEHARDRITVLPFSRWSNTEFLSMWHFRSRN